MEEIDNIIIESLRNLHCDIEEDITSLKQFDVDMIVTAISTCLEAITPGISLQKKLPPSMTLKLKYTSNLAEQIKELGFREDMGYQTILYCNESEIRRVLMFLIERLPRESNKTINIEQTGYVPTLVKEIEKRVKQSLEQLWLPSSCYSYTPGTSRNLHTRNLKYPRSDVSFSDEALKNYFIHNVSDVTKQCGADELIPSLLFEDSKISCNDTYLRKCLDLTPKSVSSDLFIRETELVSSENLDLVNNQASVDLKPEKVDKLQELLENLKERQARFFDLQESIKNYEMQLAHTNTMQCDEEDVLKSTLAKINLKSKTLTVISKEENLQKLKNLIENSNNKLIQLADQWNQIQTPLLEEYKTLQNSLSSEDLKAQEEQMKLKKLRDTYVSLDSDLKAKVILEQQLREKMDQISKNHNRNGFTRRILEIIANIKKQDREIQKILNDTKDVQKEINSLTGQVDRSFTLSDELIFRDAKHDETARKCYKLLAQLRDECASIIKAVTELGLVERESRNLQDQIDLEAAKETSVKLDRVNKDLAEIKKEIEMLN